MPFPPLPAFDYGPSGAQAASAAASIYNALQSAANQQANQQRTAKAAQVKQGHDDLQRQFENELQLQKEGAQKAPLSQDPYVVGAGRPTLTKRESEVPGGDPNAPDAPQAMPAGQTIREPKSGVLYTNPSDLDKGKTFIPQGKLADMLEQAGHERGKPMTPSDSHTLMEAINLAQPKKGGPFHIDTSGRFRDAQGKEVPVIIDDTDGSVRMLDLSGIGKDSGAQPAQPGAAPTQQGLPPGYLGGGLPGGAFDGAAQPAQRGAAPAQPGGGPFSFALPDKPAKEPRKETSDDWIRIMTDPESDPKEVTRATAALKLARAASTEADKDRDLQRAEMAADRAERRGERAQAVAEKQDAVNRGIKKTKKKAISDALKTYRKAVGVAITDKDKQAALADLRSDLDDAQKEYEGDVSDESGNEIPHNAWAKDYDPDAPGDATTPAPKANGAAPAQPNATPAQQGAAPAAPAQATGVKTASLAQIRDYAKKNSLSEAEAIRKAKAEGYSIGK